MAKRFSLKTETRRRRAIELHVQGANIPEIVQKLNAENIKVSERTIWSDLHSEMADDYLSPFAKELIRRQAKAIEEHKNPLVKLRYRDRLIGKVLPRREISKIELKGDLKIDEQPDNIRDFTAEEREEIRKAGRILLAKRSGQARPAGV